ncbi:undecaprenyldiphospho-muramoylpentapeptide beta-N-acetylglucosaminyltransferase [Psychrosphaera aquimarina]|uniref:UDP-N-acetylglucosamine--N-acetylmuramyl-(pentapeptide) pyrophosphoryl-undecaprenol N-acetylglucosamine transferase n=1 Tax=Psychrosphaera aquimarina TaxID=2044854 RepID=A0ABU3R0J2_9GAMM|nr:undecaprenyldiphospho-muramoylpentapeptide beta-N-acetylglucosaminyltransferase [Psychrosphaera aquimarina]MDU0113203.1 undecaprenyldiphospho-muramoylpentapeptide beta-N-acetylglucosaminyltransferase [Psychrosphaera aquimarina]
MNNSSNNSPIQTKRAVIMAGGTGGHIFPGLALAKSLMAEGWDVQWMGTADKMEADIVPKHDISIHYIDVKGVRGNGIKRLVKAPFMLLKAWLQARAIFKKLKPNLVIGFGGYASGPGGIAAWSLGLPLIIHEQNAIAGMTNRWLSKVAKHTLLAFPNAKQSLPKIQTEVVGNPVRMDIAQLNNMPKRVLTGQDAIRILVIGGSLGARALNQQLPHVFYQLQALGLEVKVHHQVGKGNKLSVTDEYDKCKNSAEVAELSVVIDEFIDDMPSVLSWADLVICRAGALTVSELAASGNVGVFIPLPYAVDDHQTANANWLVEKEAAVLMPQNEIKQKLVSTLVELINDPNRINQMQINAKQQAILTTTDRMVELCQTWK